MSGFWNLTAHSLRRVRTLVLATGLLLAIFQVVMIAVARSIQRSDAFNQIGVLIPPFLRELLGPSFTSVMSFQGVVCAGYFELAVLIALVAIPITLGTIPVSEVETGFADLILSRPVPRHWIVTRAIVVSIGCSALLLSMMMGGTFLGLRLLAPPNVTWPSLRLIASLVENLGATMLCWAGIAMAIGCASRRRSVAGGLTGLLALATFLLDYVGRAWEPADKLAVISPYRYYNPFDLVLGLPLPTKNIVVLMSIATVGFVTAYVFFSRRDISH